MDKLGQVQFGDATIKYELHRSHSRRKTVQITMDSGHVLATTPMDTPGPKLETKVHKRAPWILWQSLVPPVKIHASVSSA